MAHDIRRAPRRHLTALLLGCTALIASPALSQDTASLDNGVGTPDEPYRLSTIIIDASGQFDDDANSIVAQELWTGGKVATSVLDTPASVSVITTKEIEDRGAKTLEEVLEYSSGIHTNYYSSDDRNDYVLVRGFQATSYRDGLTLGSMRGVREDPYAFERVEVIRGGNSTLFGTADPGGTINFVTKTPKFERLAEAQLTYSSYNRTELGLDFGDVFGGEQNLAWRFTAKVQDGEREYAPSKDDAQLFMGGVSWQPSDATTLSVVADYLKRDASPNSGGYPKDREYDRSDFYGVADYNYQNVERSSITGLLTHDFGGGLKLSANLRYSKLTDDYGYIYLNDPEGRVGTLVGRSYIQSRGTANELIGNVVLQYDTSFGNFESSTLAGLEYRDADTTTLSAFDANIGTIDLADLDLGAAPSTLSYYNDSSAGYKTKSAFLQQNIAFDDRFIATLGLRHDWLDLSNTDKLSGTPVKSSDDFSESSIRGALTYKITPEISAYLSYVESVAPPAIGVEPERGEQYELGVKYAPSGMNALFSASIYDLTKQNMTIRVFDDAGVPQDRAIGEARVRGIDLEGKAEIADNINLIAAYSYMDSEFVTADDIRSGNEFGNVPNHLASIWVNYTVPGTETRGDMTFGLGARYVGSYYYAPSNATGKSPAVTTLDAAFTYQVQDNTTLAINVSNLLDEQHVVGKGTADYYNAGREITATLRHRF